MEILWHQAWRLGLSWKKWARITQCLHTLLLPTCSPWCQPPFPAQGQSCLTSPAASGFFSGAGNSCSLEKLLGCLFMLLFSWYCFCYHFWWESKNNSKNSTKTVLFVFLCFFPAQPLTRKLMWWHLWDDFPCPQPAWKCSSSQPAPTAWTSQLFHSLGVFVGFVLAGRAPLLPWPCRRSLLWQPKIPGDTRALSCAVVLLTELGEKRPLSSLWPVSSQKL